MLIGTLNFICADCQVVVNQAQVNISVFKGIVFV